MGVHVSYQYRLHKQRTLVGTTVPSCVCRAHVKNFVRSKDTIEQRPQLYWRFVLLFTVYVQTNMI